MTNLARTVPGGRIHHLVTADGGATRCGKTIGASGWAVWPISLNNRVDARPLCGKCRDAAR